jgi:predicted nuclease of restriction endonuclease-like RecB superfamily
VPYSVVGGEAVPHYLTERDHPWLRKLLDEFDAFVEQPRRDLEVHLRRCGFLQGQPIRDRARLAGHVLFQLVGTKIADDCLPAETRLELFELAADLHPPELALKEIAERLGLTPTAVAQALFADLAEERLIQPVPPDLHPGAVALAANLAMAQALVRRATFAEVRVAQRSRALVRAAKLWGLLCVVKEFSRSGGTVLEITGALARMRTTTRYGYAMARLLPLLPWCGTEPGSDAKGVVTDVTTGFEPEPGSVPNDFQLRARCRLGNQDLWFQVRAGDPLPAADEPKAFDSTLEERFAKEFRRAAPYLELVREPEPIPTDGGFLFPDFRIQDPHDPDHSCLVEIIGYWTEDYLRKKLAGLRSLAAAAGGSRRGGKHHGGEPWILCVDEQLWYVECNRPEHMQIVWYQRRIDPEQVLQAWLATE